MKQPDNWVVLKITHPDHEKPVYKILAGWSGGYMTGDSWQLNSGVVKVESDDDYYYFHGYSGSVYKCHKDSETLRNNNAYIYQEMKQRYPDNVEIVAAADIDWAVE